MSGAGDQPGRDVSGTLLPVGVGADIGTYALLRAFHEEYGCDAICVSAVAMGSVSHSSFVTNEVVPGITDPLTLVATLEDVAARHPGRTLVLLTNTDWYVATLVEHQERLRRSYLLAVCSPQAFETLSTKTGFADVCDRVGVRTPAGIAVDLAALRADGGHEAVRALGVPFDFPVIAKPSSSDEYHYLQMPGKQKIYTLADRAELDDLLHRLLDAGYTGTFLVQDMIPGDETHLRSLTAYRDTRGAVTLLATGQVLLQEHTPGALGIPAAILVEPYSDAMDSARRVLDEADYVGFANFDFKLDPRSGEHVFFEVNPRVGRNNWYVTAGGASTAKAVVADLVERRSTPTVVAEREVLYNTVPFWLLLRYIRDGALRRRLRAVRRAGRMVHPLRYRGDVSWRRRAVVEVMTANHVRKFFRYYPRPTETGF